MRKWHIYTREQSPPGRLPWKPTPLRTDAQPDSHIEQMREGGRERERDAIFGPDVYIARFLLFECFKEPSDSASSVLSASQKTPATLSNV